MRKLHNILKSLQKYKKYNSNQKKKEFLELSQMEKLFIVSNNIIGNMNNVLTIIGKR